MLQAGLSHPGLSLTRASCTLSVRHSKLNKALRRMAGCVHDTRMILSSRHIPSHLSVKPEASQSNGGKHSVENFPCCLSASPGAPHSSAAGVPSAR